MAVLTRERADEMLKTLETPMVRTSPVGRNNGQHCHKARLLRLEGKDRAVVQPAGHKKEEIMKLGDLHEWKSANETGYKKMTEEITTSNGSPATKLKEIKEKFAVVSCKQKAMFGGAKKRWTHNPGLAVSYESETRAKMAASKIRKNKESDDAESMPFIEARELIVDLRNPKPQKPEIKEEAVAKDPHESIELEPELANLLQLNLQQMAEFDPSPFIAALQKRAKAVQDFAESKELLIAAIRDIKNAEAEARVAIQGLMISPFIEETQSKTKTKKSNKNNSVKDAVRKILSEDPNTFLLNSLTNKILELGISKSATPRTVIRSSIKEMIERKEIKVNPNNTLALP